MHGYNYPKGHLRRWRCKLSKVYIGPGSTRISLPQKSPPTLGINLQEHLISPRVGRDLDFFPLHTLELAQTLEYPIEKAFFP
jgi:hypothetical protein